MIRLEDITIRFGGVTALDAVSADFAAPVSAIIGPNGAGKTTTINMISGFLRGSGRIMWNDTDLTALPPHKRARWGVRRCFQKEQIAEDLSVYDNLLAMLDPLAGSRADKKADIDRALGYVGMTGKAHRLAAELNQFDRRRTDIARCLVGQPKLVLLDEPAGGLSAQESLDLGGLIAGIHGLTGAMTLVIDHDVDLIERICHDALVLDFGRKIAFGATRDVLADPHVQAAYLGTEEVL